MAEDKEQIDFTWKGKDKNGKVISGEIAAFSDTVARAELRKQSIRVISVRKKQRFRVSEAV